MVRCPRKRETKYAWLVCFSASIANGMTMSIVFGYGIFLPVFMIEFNESREKTALLGSLTFFLGMFLTILTGKICDRFGCRTSLTIGTFICTLSILLSSWATGMAYLFLSLGLAYGFGIAFAMMSCFLMVSSYFHKRRPLAIGFVTAGASCGFIISAPIMQALNSSIGWRNAFRVEAGMLLSCYIPAILLFDPNVESEIDIDRVIQPTTRHERARSWEKLKITLNFCGLPYIISVTLLFILSFSHYSVPIHLVRHCEEIGISGAKSSYLYLGMGLGSLFFRIASGKLCQFINPLYLNQASGIISGISTLVISMTKSYAVLVVTTIVYGFADGTFQTTCTCIPVHAVQPEKRAVALGWSNMITSLALPFGPMSTGRIADVYSYKIAFIVAGVLSIVGSLVPLVLCCTKNESQTRTSYEMTDELVVLEKLSVV